MFFVRTISLHLINCSGISPTHKFPLYKHRVFKSIIFNKNNILKRCFRKLNIEPVGITDGDDFSGKIKLNETANFSDNLIKWAVQNNISNLALSKLLKVLKEHGIKDLPVNSKVLLQAKENEIKVSNMPPGVYTHFGFQKNLQKLMLCLMEKNIFSGTQISLSIFIDQLPLVRLTQQGLWVILGSVEGFPNNIFLIGLYTGYANPKSPNLFLSEFVKEAKVLTEKGIEINNVVFFSVKIKRLICDAVAKSFVLNIKNHLSYSSCTKCNAVGKFKNKAISFLEKGAPRKDEDFEDNGIYRTAKTILLEIPDFGVVSNVTIDYMHLVCLGVVKKLLTLWLFNKNYWITEKSTLDIIKSTDFACPCEFHILAKSFKQVHQWVAKDFREFLIYYGPVILKDRLKEVYYNHFLLLHVACKLLCTEASMENISYGRELLNNFVENYNSLYESEGITHNIHGLYHLADECISHGVLDNFSSFPFEKFLTKLKNSMDRKKRRMIPQTILSESYDSIFQRNLSKLTSNNIKVSKTKKTSEKSEGFSHFEVLSLKNFKIIPESKGDSYVFLKNDKIIQVTDVVKEKLSKNYYIAGKEFLSVSNFYSEPYESLKLGTFVVSELSDKVDMWPVELIDKKGFIIPINNEKSVLINLLDNNL